MVKRIITYSKRSRHSHLLKKKKKKKKKKKAWLSIVIWLLPNLETQILGNKEVRLNCI